MDFLAGKTAARGGTPNRYLAQRETSLKTNRRGILAAGNPLAEFSATRDLQPGDSPEWIRDRLLSETRDILLVGHFPHLPRLLALLLGQPEASAPEFPSHGLVALTAAASAKIG